MVVICINARISQNLYKETTNNGYFKTIKSRVIDFFTFPYPGNYPKEIWEKIVECIRAGLPTDIHGFIRNNYPIRILEKKYFLLLDIHEFSHLCKDLTSEDKTQSICHFLDYFFSNMSERIDRSEGEVIKFVGDAILSVHEEEEPPIELAKKLIDYYKATMKIQYQFTNLTAVIGCPEVLIKGFSGSSSYMDYSYWGTGLNSLFKAIKDVDEGKVYFIEKDGTPTPCDC